jgi:tRNA threonylcarbamoyladenosine biosynthesis protein TsaE
LFLDYESTKGGFVMEKVTHSAEESIEFGKYIGSKLHRGDVIAYFGGLGMGKTTITRGIVMGLGLKDDVFSPTFTLSNEYRGEGINVYHFDMYRILGMDGLEGIGFFDYPLEDNVTIIEWAENVEEIFNEDTIRITIERIDDDTRKFTVDGGDRFC